MNVFSPLPDFSWVYPALYIGKTRVKGRGVFTHQRLPANTLIEVSPVIVLSGGDKTILQNTLLSYYYFDWPVTGGNECCMALGNISIYNHAYDANCQHEKHADLQCMSIRTMRAIEPGEELTINYNGTWNDASPIVWFDVD